MAVWLYKISVASGKFDILRGSIAGISQDQRIQFLLIGFCFNAFLEGAAGFGVPIAICAVLLVSLGFKPLYYSFLISDGCISFIPEKVETKEHLFAQWERVPS